MPVPAKMLGCIAAIPDEDIANARRALLEIRHARLRIHLADCELEWVAINVVAAKLDPDAALAILDQVMDVLAEGGS